MIKGGIGNLMKQPQLMQENLQKAQARIAEMEVEGQSGAGMVKVVMTGKHDVKRVAIDPSLLGDASDDGREMLEDLLAAAVNDAVRRVEEKSAEMMSGVTAGMPLPPGMKLPF